MTTDAHVVASPLQGTLLSVEVAVGDTVVAGQLVAVIESMKMEHVVEAPSAGTVVGVDAGAGATVQRGQPLVRIRPVAVAAPSASAGRGAPTAHATAGEATEATAGTSEAAVDADAVVAARPDLAEVVERHALGNDERRPEAVARRHDRGQRTARENIADLVDAGSFVEYGPLAIAAQRRRREVRELIERTPADGLVGGLAMVHGRAVVVASYDYTVLAGTQGYQNHRKKDRLFELAAELRLPVVLFAEGGGGRPGDTDSPGVSGLDTMAFRLFAELSGLVPLVGITSGRCFAGNAALLGCCDVVIATSGSNIGMGGPAMIEGGGLGAFDPEEIGPLDVQVANGVVDVAVADEAEAVDVARRYLSYFHGDQAPGGGWRAGDPAALRAAVPENRVRVYDMRALLAGVLDTDSVLELRAGFGAGMVTALGRVEGRPLGVLANNPAHLGGAIDADAADKAARFLQLCDAFDLPVLSVCDTPGFMVGPAAEETALVRHVSRMFVTGANLTVPLMTVITRKAYGLGAQAMAGGSFKSPVFTVAWPTGEVGGMGLEGAVRLGYRRELEAIEDDAEREAAFQEMVARSYEHGKALNSATHYEIDDVIDPADTRRWISAALEAAPSPAPRTGKKRPNIDAW